MLRRLPESANIVEQNLVETEVEIETIILNFENQQRCHAQSKLDI